MESATKKQKLSNASREISLNSIYDWCTPENTAIEYHDSVEIRNISYADVWKAKLEVEEILKQTQSFEFIGINHDIKGYCIPSLILGINSSGHGFINLSPSTSTDTYERLRIKYLFSERPVSETVLTCDLKIHGQRIQFLKSKNIPTSTNQNYKKKSFSYAITTSGSTGIPKIVRVPPSCIIPNILDLKNTLQLTRCDKIAQLTTLTFDPSIVEIFLSLSCGGTMFMVSKEIKEDPSKLLNLIFEHKVTLLQSTPSLLFARWSSDILKKTIFSRLSFLRILLLGGEPFPKIDIFSAIKHIENKTRIFNIYGITEVSCWASINEIEPSASSNELASNTRYLGRPLTETLFEVRSRENVNGVHEGVLYIGSCSRICYVDNEEIQDFTDPVFRKSGDLVTIDERGNIYYKGRCDSIVKRFGNRLKLMELEKKVLELKFVKNCVALWDEENHKLNLCVSATFCDENCEKLDEHVKAHLREMPAFYQPDKIKFVENFVLTKNGKICTTSLKKVLLELNDKVSGNNAINTAIVKETFERVWRDFFPLSEFGFLEMGGTSVQALQLSTVLSNKLQVEFPELIGTLLRNGKFKDCLVHVLKKVQGKEKIINKVVIDLSPSQTAASRFKGDEQTEAEDSETSVNISQLEECKWQKCRGRTSGHVPQETIDIQRYNKMTIEILTLHDLRKCVDASPTVFQYASGKVYASVGSHSGHIWTTELSDSENVNYKIELPDRIEASVLVLNDFKGIVGCYDGYVYCVDLRSGKTHWKLKTGDMVKCTAILSRDRQSIFVGSYDHYLYCITAKNGSVEWKVKASKGSISATPCASSKCDLLFCGTLDGTCIALHQKSGKVVWKTKLDNPIFSAPAILENSDVVFCSVSGKIVCFNAENGESNWAYSVDGNVFSHLVVKRNPTTNTESIFFACQNKQVYRLEVKSRLETPTLKFTVGFECPIFATPFWESDLVIVVDTSGTLHALDSSSGDILTSFTLNGDVFSSPVIHGDFIVVGCRDNNFYVLKIT